MSKISRQISEVDRSHRPLCSVVPVTLENLDYARSKISSVPARPDSYQNCPLYFFTTMRAGGWIIESDGQFLFACLHPHNQNEIMLFPERSEKGSFSLTIIDPAVIILKIAWASSPL